MSSLKPGKEIVLLLVGRKDTTNNATMNPRVINTIFHDIFLAAGAIARWLGLLATVPLRGKTAPAPGNSRARELEPNRTDAEPYYYV